MGNAIDAQVTGGSAKILLQIGVARDLAVFEQRCAAAARNGFDGVELVLPDEAAAHPQLDNRTSARHIRAVATRCTTLDVGAATEQLTALLPTAAAWGAIAVNVATPPINAADSDLGFSRYQEGLNFTYRLLHAIRYEAESTGVTVAVEAAHGGCLLSPVELREIIDDANSWAVGACLDLDNVRRIGLAEDWIATLGRRVLALRASFCGTFEPSRVRAALTPFQALLNSAGSSAPLIADPSTRDA